MYDFFVRQEFHNKDLMSQAKRQFVRFVSHEVRTPLNVVCLGLQLLQEDMAKLLRETGSSGNTRPETEPGANLSRHRETVTTSLLDWSNISNDILGNAQSAVDVLSDLLNYDKIESQTLNLELAITSIEELVRQASPEFQLQAQFKSITFRLVSGRQREADSDLESIFNNTEWSEAPMNASAVVDPTRLVQLLRNLISNALKFTPEHGKSSNAESYSWVCFDSFEPHFPFCRCIIVHQVRLLCGPTTSHPQVVWERRRRPFLPLLSKLENPSV